MSADADFPETMVTTKPREKDETKTRRVPPYNVILENDDYHSFEFVVDVLQKALGYNQQRAFLLTHQAHTSGRAVVWTGTKEVAELKLEQIRSFHEIRQDGPGVVALRLEHLRGGHEPVVEDALPPSRVARRHHLDSLAATAAHPVDAEHSKSA